MGKKIECSFTFSLEYFFLHALLSLYFNITGKTIIMKKS